MAEGKPGVRCAFNELRWHTLWRRDAAQLRCDRAQIQDSALAPPKPQMSGFQSSRRKGGPGLASYFRIRDIAGNERREIGHPECVGLTGDIHLSYIEITNSAVQGSLPPDEPTRITCANIVSQEDSSVLDLWSTEKMATSFSIHLRQARNTWLRGT